MNRRKVSTSVYLEPRQIEGLRARAARTGTPVAAIVRRAIDRELAPARISWTKLITREFVASLSPIEKLLLARRWEAEDKRRAAEAVR